MTLLAIAIVLTLILVVADVRSLPAKKFDFIRKLGERRAPLARRAVSYQLSAVSSRKEAASRG